MGSSRPAACVTPSTSGLRTPSTWWTTSATPWPARRSCSTQTSSGWSASSWTVTPGCQSSSARNVTPSSTSATASWSGSCRESTSLRSGKRTWRASESEWDLERVFLISSGILQSNVLFFLFLGRIQSTQSPQLTMVQQVRIFSPSL